LATLHSIGAGLNSMDATSHSIRAESHSIGAKPFLQENELFMYKFDAKS
jgi:hypothetical protein